MIEPPRVTQEKSEEKKKDLSDDDFDSGFDDLDDMLPSNDKG